MQAPPPVPVLSWHDEPTKPHHFCVCYKHADTSALQLLESGSLLWTLMGELDSGGVEGDMSGLCWTCTPLLPQFMPVDYYRRSRPFLH